MLVSESIVRDMMRLFVWYPLRWTIELVPVSWGMMIVRAMGDVHCAASFGKKRQLKDNLRRLRGTREASEENRIVREYFRNHYLDRLLIFIFPKFGARETEQFVEFEGLEYLDSALQSGKGVILVHGHVGPAHLPLVALARIGYRMKQIGLPSDEGLSWIGKNIAFKLRLRYEAKIPAEIIKADGFMRSAFRWLGGNGIIMITGDGGGTEKKIGRHEIFDFCGQPVPFPLGPALLAEKTGSAILPMFLVPGERKRFRVVIEPPVNSIASGEEKVRIVTRHFLKRLEFYVSRSPGWMHFLDRFTPGQLIEHGETVPMASKSAPGGNHACN